MHDNIILFNEKKKKWEIKDTKKGKVIASASSSSQTVEEIDLGLKFSPDLDRKVLIGQQINEPFIQQLIVQMKKNN